MVSTEEGKHQCSWINPVMVSWQGSLVQFARKSHWIQDFPNGNIRRCGHDSFCRKVHRCSGVPGSLIVFVFSESRLLPKTDKPHPATHLAMLSSRFSATAANRLPNVFARTPWNGFLRFQSSPCPFLIAIGSAHVPVSRPTHNPSLPSRNRADHRISWLFLSETCRRPQTFPFKIRRRHRHEQDIFHVSTSDPEAFLPTRNQAIM